MNIQNLTEKEIVDLAKSGNMQALEFLYEKNIDSLYKFVRFKVGSNEIAEDICSEAFLRVFENISKFKGKSSFKTYVYTIAKNLVYDSYKREKVLELDETWMIGDKKDKKSMKRIDDDSKLISQILSNLSEKESEVLEARYLMELSVKETAILLSISESNVKVLTHRALKKAQSKYKHE